MTKTASCTNKLRVHLN